MGFLGVYIASAVSGECVAIQLQSGVDAKSEGAMSGALYAPFALF